MDDPQCRRARAAGEMSLRQSFLIGLAQAAALAPGISRSGTTIAAGLAQGLPPRSSGPLQLSVGAPVFLGAGLLQVGDMLATDPAAVLAELPALLVGFITSAVCGYAAIRFLLAYVRRNTLYLFSCVLSARQPRGSDTICSASPMNCYLRTFISAFFRRCSRG